MRSVFFKTEIKLRTLKFVLTMHQTITDFNFPIYFLFSFWLNLLYVKGIDKRNQKTRW